MIIFNLQNASRTVFFTKLSLVVRADPLITSFLLFNPIKAGRGEGLNLCIDRGASYAPPPKKALENMYRVEIHVHSPNFQGQLTEKKTRSINFVVWVLGRVGKMPKKRSKNVRNIIFCLRQISKCDTCFYIYFSKAF